MQHNIKNNAKMFIISNCFEVNIDLQNQTISF